LAARRISRGQLRREDLDDDLATERRFLSDENARHATAAQLALQRVRVAQRSLKLIAEVHDT
jgi:hypothetical protein